MSTRSLSSSQSPCQGSSYSSSPRSAEPGSAEPANSPTLQRLSLFPGPYEPFSKELSLLIERVDHLYTQGQALSEEASATLCRDQIQNCATVEEAVSVLEKNCTGIDQTILYNLINLAQKSGTNAELNYLLASGKNANLISTPTEQIDRLYWQGRRLPPEQSHGVCEKILKYNDLGKALSFLERKNIAVDFDIQQTLSEIAYNNGALDESHAIIDWGFERKINCTESYKWQEEGIPEKHLYLLNRHLAAQDLLSLPQRIDELFMQGDRPSKKLSLRISAHIRTCESLEEAISFLEISDIKIDKRIFDHLMKCAEKTDTWELVDCLFKNGKKNRLLNSNHYTVFIRLAYKAGQFKSAQEGLDLLQKDRVPLNPYSLMTLMQFAGKTGNFEDLRQLFELGKKKRIVNDHHFATLIHFMPLSQEQLDLQDFSENTNPVISRIVVNNLVESNRLAEGLQVLENALRSPSPPPRSILS